MTDDADEPRVRDLLRRDDGSGITEQDLMAWFGRPSFAQLDDLGAPPSPPPELDPELAAVRKRRETAIANVNPQLLAHILRHDDVHLTRLPPPLPGFDERPPMMLFDDAAVPAIPAPDEWPVRERGDELEDAVRMCTPQAFLRDLHRPEKDFEILHESAYGDQPDESALDAGAAAVREALATDWRLREQFPAALAQIAKDHLDRRSLMARPWAEAKSARAKQREAELLGKEAAAAAVPPGPEPAS